MQKTTLFLMFNGQAEEAMNLYISLFRDSAINSITRYKAGESGTEGTVMLATFTLQGQEYRCIDSSISHAFSFTPSMSIYVRCETPEEVERLFTALSSEGNVLMPLDTYPFSKKYGWTADKFGVSWQLDLQEN